MASASRPNILLLHVDEQPWDALSVEGNQAIRTPSIDRLATQGCRFSYCFTQHLDPVYARAALMTGQYPSRLGSTAVLSHSPMLLPRLLRPYGYRCAGMGAMQLTSVNRDWRRPYPDLGFDQLEVSDAFGREDAYSAHLQSRHSDAGERVSSALVQGERGGQFYSLPPDSTPNAFVGSRALGFLQQQARTGQPFFCKVGFRAFHYPLVMPQRFLALYEPEKLPLPDIFPYLMDRFGVQEDQLRRWQHGYYATISEIDHHVGILLQELERLQLSQNTVVVYTAGRGRFAGPLLEESGTWIPDVMARVPLIVRGPADMVLSELHCNSMVEAVDIVPTLLELVDIPRPPEIQGKSFVPVLAGESRQHRDSSILELPDRRLLRTRYFQYVIRDDGLESLFDVSKPETVFTDVSNDLRYRGTVMDHRHQLILRMLKISA